MLLAAALALRLLLNPEAQGPAAAQTTAPSQTTQTPPPAETPPQLPINFSKVKAGVNAGPTLDLVDKSPFRFYSETVRPLPKFSDIVGSFDLFNGPVPHSGMTHGEFVQSTRPKELFSAAGFSPGDVIRWGLLTFAEGKAYTLVKNGIKRLIEAKTEAERKQIREQIDRELAALRGEIIK